ncbi:uncharacterized protein N7511_005848 [Penicillium nucicola]|uniref:uncharacterized protein n=1 Tax=Penicillium nucicola TaxID=1850975 RepID=UPI002545627F|nr:uncharacterized protein N7511_005848 [Penicillium nucicola]KAJ5762466.1 hypothetical protein N7511_005848 [Penicillium nucicola]
MYFSDSLIWILSLTASTAHGYQLDFHKESAKRCSSEAIGSWSGDVSSGCHENYAGVAHGVTVTPGDNERGSVVAFYDSNDCDPAHLIKKQHLGCSSQSYRSFQVVDRESHFKVEKPISARSFRNSDSDYEALRRETENPPARHGDEFEHNGVTRRWHQIARGVFTGVPAYEWDDEIHQARDHELDLTSDNYSIAERDVDESLVPFLLERDLEDSRCMTTVRCTADIARRGYGGLKKWGDKLVTMAAAAAKEAKKPLWEFLNEPFIATLAGGPVGLAGTVGAMFINNKFEPGLDKDQAAQCMTEDTAKALIEAINAQIVALNRNTAAHETRVEGSRGQLADVSVAVDEGGHKPTECDAAGN